MTLLKVTSFLVLKLKQFIFMFLFLSKDLLLYGDILNSAEILIDDKKSADKLLSELQEHLLNEQLSDYDSGKYYDLFHLQFFKIKIKNISHLYMLRYVT